MNLHLHYWRNNRHLSNITRNTKWKHQNIKNITMMLKHVSKHPPGGAGSRRERIWSQNRVHSKKNILVWNGPSDIPTVHALSNAAALSDPHPPCSNPVTTDWALLFLLGFVCSHSGSLCTWQRNCSRRNMDSTWEASGHIGDGWKSCASGGGQGSRGVNGRRSHLAQVGRVRLIIGPRRGRLRLPGVWKKEKRIKR